MTWDLVAAISRLRETGVVSDEEGIRGWRSPWTPWQAERDVAMLNAWDLWLHDPNSMGFSAGSPLTFPNDPRGRLARASVNVLTALDLERQARNIRWPDMRTGIQPLAKIYERILDRQHVSGEYTFQTSGTGWFVKAKSVTVLGADGVVAITSHAPAMTRVLVTGLTIFRRGRGDS